MKKGLRKKGLSSNSIPATTINQELIDMVKNFGFEENYADELTILIPTVEISGNNADLYS